MKKKSLIVISALLFFFSANLISEKSVSVPAQVTIGFQYFYDGLSPYGSWVAYPGYGYAWIPRTAVGFRPYLSNGRWVFTDLGWTWVSYYDWGWAPFHYGSWLFDPAYGWLWIPGYDWAPAWVVWGSYGDYYGWAPCSPSFSVSIGYYPPIDYWCFAHPRYIAAGSVTNYYVASDHRIAIGSNAPISNVNRISMVRNYKNYSGKVYYSGPPRDEFERVGKTSVQPIAIKESENPGKTGMTKNSVSLYRPQINSSDRNTAKPSKVQSLDKIKPGNETKMERISPVQNQDLKKNEGQKKNDVPAINQNRSTGKQQKTEGAEQIKNKPVEKNNPPVNTMPKKTNPPPVHKEQAPIRKKEQNIIPEQKRMEQIPQQQKQVTPNRQKEINPPVNHQQHDVRKAGPPQQQQVPMEKNHGPK